MEEEKYYCYLCGKQLTDDNNSDEHIILNAIGGHLHSYTLLCKECNSKLGEKADAKLAEDLSFFTDMLQVKKNRSNPHKQVMTDDVGNEFVVQDAGAKYNLRKPSAKLEKEGDAATLHITARNMDEVKGLLKKCVNSGKITQKQADDVIAQASMSEHRPVLSKNASITTEAFPSIVKSAVNFYLDLFHDAATIQHLIPYVKGEKDCNEVLYLYILKDLPYSADTQQVTHMIHLEGHRDTNLLYAMMEYFGIYTYVVVLDTDYQGEDINKTYAYDVIAGKEVERDFSLKLSKNDLEAFRNQSHEEYEKYLRCVQERANNVMAVWDKRQRKNVVDSVIDEVFANHSDESVFTEAMANEISEKVAQQIVNRMIDASRIINKK